MPSAPEELGFLGHPIRETNRDEAALLLSRASGSTKHLSPALSSHEKGIHQRSCAALQQSRHEERGRQSVLSEARSGHGCRSREGAMGQQWKQVAGHAWLLVPNEPRTTSPEQPDEHSGSLGCSVPLLLLLTPG